jgi:pimeloyl-ACP methyl ester carboxylesterase
MKRKFFPFSFFLLLVYISSCKNSNTGTTQNQTEAVPELKSVFINGDSIHYIDVGEGDPIVLVHGVMGDYRTWEAQMDDFSRNNRVIAYSLRFMYPNKQLLDSTADYSLSQTIKDLIELLKALKLGPVHLVGHSSGAFAALMTTIEHPELVRSLTLGEPPVMPLLKNVPGGDTLEQNFGKTIFPGVEAFKNNEDEKAAEIFMNAVMGDSLYFTKHPQRIREITMANTVQLKGSMLYPTTGFPDISCDDLEKIKTPVLLLQGDRSPLFFGKIIDELDRCLSNKERVTLPNASHGLEFENPAEFNKIVLGFIDKH